MTYQEFLAQLLFKNGHRLGPEMGGTQHKNPTPGADYEHPLGKSNGIQQERPEWGRAFMEGDRAWAGPWSDHYQTDARTAGAMYRDPGNPEWGGHGQFRSNLQNWLQLVANMMSNIAPWQLPNPGSRPILDGPPLFDVPISANNKMGARLDQFVAGDGNTIYADAYRAMNPRAQLGLASPAPPPVGGPASTRR